MSVLLFGGGLDSGALVEWAMRQSAKLPYLFYVDYGAHATGGEVKAMNYFATKYDLKCRVVPLSNVFGNSPLIDKGIAEKHADNFIPGRNLLFVALASSFAATIGEEEILVGFHKEADDSVYEDAKKPFLEEFNSLNRRTYGELAPALIAPFIDREQEDYIADAYRCEPALFAKTMSCYNPDPITNEECGECTHCKNKTRLFLKLNNYEA